jgi:transcriptional regulator GlxA family with amidase domain
MHHVAFVVYPGFELLDMSGPVSVFTSANRSRGLRDEPPFYSIDLVSSAGGPVTSSSGVAVETQSLEERARKAVDTLLIAGAEREHLLPVLADPAWAAWLPKLAGKAQRFGSVCSGVVILARLGLLDGHRVGTHWDACAPLAAAFPSVTVDPDSLYVVDGRLWTSAGVTTGIDLALAMVAHDLSADIAGEVAKRLVLYARRPGYQSQFSPLLQAQVKADSPFAELIAWILANLDAPWTFRRLPIAPASANGRFIASSSRPPAKLRLVSLRRRASMPHVCFCAAVFRSSRLRPRSA